MYERLILKHQYTFLGQALRQQWVEEAIATPPLFAKQFFFAQNTQRKEIKKVPNLYECQAKYMFLRRHTCVPPLNLHFWCKICVMILCQDLCQEANFWEVYWKNQDFSSYKEVNPNSFHQFISMFALWESMKYDVKVKKLFP